MDILSKSERNLAAYLRSRTSAIASIRATRDGGGPVSGALLLVQARSSTNSTLPPAAGTYQLDLVFTLSVVEDSGSTPGRSVDALGELQCALLDLDSAKAFCNSGTKRAAGAFHLHDLEIVNHSVTTDDRRLIHTIVARILVTNADQ